MPDTNEPYINPTTYHLTPPSVESIKSDIKPPIALVETAKSSDQPPVAPEPSVDHEKRSL
jgi:hypothetical protein